MPIQSNSYDCGAFVLAKKLKIVFDLPCDFTQESMANFRRHAALQLHQGMVHLPSYAIPEENMSTSSIHDGPLPRLRFHNNVQVFDDAKMYVITLPLLVIIQAYPLCLSVNEIRDLKR